MLSWSCFKIFPFRGRLFNSFQGKLIYSDEVILQKAYKSENKMRRQCMSADLRHDLHLLPGKLRLRINLYINDCFSAKCAEVWKGMVINNDNIKGGVSA